MKPPSPAATKSYRNSSKYKKWRERMFAREPLCRMCAAEGISTATTQIDHIKPLATHWELRWDSDNAQGLCDEHHNAKTKAENDARHAHARGHLWNDFNARLAELVKESEDGPAT